MILSHTSRLVLPYKREILVKRHNCLKIIKIFIKQPSKFEYILKRYIRSLNQQVYVPEHETLMTAT